MLRFREDFYSGQLPGPEDVLPVIEVADSSLEYDRNIKARLYAKAGIPEFLIADLASEKLLSFLDPAGEGYSTSRAISRGEAFASVSVP